jgi:predicted nucleic acid-binding protein
MIGAVLADTGPLYALADPSDQFHDRAHRELETIVSRDNSILVVFPVLCEAHTLVLRRLGGRYAAGWLSEMLSGTLPVNPETNDYLDATVGLRKYSGHPITLVDALLARLTRRLEAPVWTFDGHFVTMRTRVWKPDTTSV